ncbi:hypothetical protein ACH5RR_035683 [Cinchona calisaya]|uniref:Uncharacterized protein n=1 Tax=Cinchona calisaya TaxID=153742 RepID=A0ABD2Y4G6_9GENT
MILNKSWGDRREKNNTSLHDFIKPNLRLESQEDIQDWVTEGLVSLSNDVANLRDGEKYTLPMITRDLTLNERRVEALEDQVAVMDNQLSALKNELQRMCDQLTQEVHGLRMPTGPMLCQEPKDIRALYAI